MKNGFGVLNYGERYYEGTFDDDKFVEGARIDLKNNIKKIGKFKSITNLKEGKIISEKITLEGKFLYNNLMVGNFDERGTGSGVITTTDNDVYEGSFQRQNIHGIGKVTYGFG